MKSWQETVRHVAHLARLELQPGEEEKLAKQFADLLSHFEKIQQLDTEGVEPTVHPLPLMNVGREDRAVLFPHREPLLKNAPQRFDEFFKVPKVIEG